MKLTYVIGVVMLFLSLGVQSQEYSELIFSHKLNHLITGKTNIKPTVFEVKNKKTNT